MNNKNYRVMKFFDSVNKNNKSRGYVRLDIRGIKGNIIVSVENLGDAKTNSEVYLYKDKTNKIKLGEINNRKGLIKKSLTFGNSHAIEDYNICAVVKDNKIAMYTSLYNVSSLEQVKKLEVDDEPINEIVDLDIPTEKISKTEISSEKHEKHEKHEKTDEEKVVREKEDNEETELVADNKEVGLEESIPVINTDNLAEIEEVPLENERIKRTSVSSAVNMNINNEEASIEEIEEEYDLESQSRRSRNKLDNSLNNVLKDYKQIEPLSVKIKNLNWWYIPYDETGIKNGYLPYYNQIVSSYYPYPMSNRVTTCSALMKKYHHYIFGIYKDKGDVVKFVYGIPGEFTREEQPYKGVTGFKNWSYSNKDNYNKHGYWLAFVNPRTGETTEPPQIELI